MSVSLVIRQLAWVPSLSLRHIRHASFFLQKILVLLSYCHVSEAAWSCSMCPWDYLSYRKPAFPQTHFMHAHECADSSPLSYIHWRECWLAHTRSCIYSYHLADGTMKKTNKKEDAKQLFVATSSLRAFVCVCVCVVWACCVRPRKTPTVSLFSMQSAISSSTPRSSRSISSSSFASRHLRLISVSLCMLCNSRQHRHART